MSRRTKKILTLLMVVAVLATMLVLPATASAFPATLTKTATPVDANYALAQGSREYEVSLDIKGNLPPQNPVDVVLVLDRSASMQGQKFTDLKAAAKSFAKTVIDGNSSNRISVVSYYTTAEVNSGFTRTGLDTLIDGLSPRGSQGDLGSTNMQAGMLLANSMLSKTNDGSGKCIVFMSDGVPTRYFAPLNYDIVDIGNRFEFKYLHNGNWVQNIHDDNVKGNGSSFDANAQTAFFTVANSVSSDVSIFTIGLMSDLIPSDVTDAEITLGASYSDGFYKTVDSTALTAIYDKISNVVSNVGNAVVTDTIPAEFTLDVDSFKVDGKDVKSPDSITVNSDNTKTTITWTHGALGGKNTVLKYRITAKAPHYGSLFTNTDAMLELNSEAHASFPKPSVLVRPYALADAYTAKSGTLLTVPVADGVQKNDANTDNEVNGWTTGALEAVVTTAASHGTVALQPDGSFTYTSVAGYVGDDTFSYQLKTVATKTESADVSLFSDIVPVKITVEKVETPPTPPTPPVIVPVTTPTNTPATNVSLNVTVVGPGKVTPGSGAYALNSMIMFSVTPDAGAQFLGWSGPDGSAVTAANYLTMSSSRTVTATFGVPIAEAVVPQAAPATPAATITQEPTPQSAPVVEEIKSVTLPQAAPELPKTGGIPLELMTGLGALLAGSGLFLNRRKKNND